MQLEFPLTSDSLTAQPIFIRAYKREFKKRLPVTISQFAVLDLLERNGNRLKPTQIAKLLGIKSGSIGTTIDNLEAGGYVIRKNDPDNRRVVYISSTPKALPVVEEGRICALEAIQKQEMPLGRFLINQLGKANSDVILTNGLNNDKSNPPGMEQYRVCKFIESKLLETLKGYSLSTIMFRILFELVEQGKEMRASDLSWRLLVLFPEITTACNELEKRRLIKRYYDNSDHRVTFIDITNEGYTLINIVAPQIDALYMTMSAELGSDNRELYLKALHLIVEGQRKNFRPE